MKKRIVVTILISIIFLNGCGVFSTNEFTKEDIFNLVNENASLVKSSVEQMENFKEGTVISTVEKYTYNEIEEDIDGLFALIDYEKYAQVKNEVLMELMKLKPIKCVMYAGDWVKFDCSPSRFGPGSYGHGFYYSAKDEPKDVSGLQLVDKFQKKGNGWIWKEKKGDNEYFTEKITDNIFYFVFSL